MPKRKSSKSAPAGAKKGRAKGRKAGADRTNSFESRLRAAISAVEVANSLTSPLTRSIENLLRVAARSVGTDEASVLVRDGTRGGLKFLIAIGQVADKLLKVRIPPGRGIAGFVFSSGQPMVVADVAQEESFYAEVDRATGYSTQTMLATPLRVNDEMVGVLEFVNREGEPPYQPFTPEEMDQAAHFADAIATLVAAHETAGLIENIFERSMAEKNVGDARHQDAVRRWLKNVRTAPEHRDLLQMALDLRDIATRGEAERELCRDLLDALARFTEKRSGSVTGYFGF